MIGSTLFMALVAIQPPDSTTGPAWYVATRYGVESVRGPLPSWQSWSITTGIRSERVSFLADAMVTTRFGLTDVALAGDGYLVLRPGTYGNLRIQVTADPEILPQWEVAAELFDALARDWEASIGYRRIVSETEKVGIISGGMARYAGDWYLRLKATLAHHPGGASPGAALLIRRYGGDRDRFLELAGGYGNELVTLGPGSVARRSAGSLFVRGQTLLGGWWGANLGASFAADEGQPRRAGIAMGAFLRW
jgi:YaiO family outer membrane protein